MNDKHETELQSLSLGRMSIILWATLLALGIVFASSLNQRATTFAMAAEEQNSNTAAVQTGAGLLETVAENTGVNKLRDAVESPIHAFYAAQPEIMAIQLNVEPAEGQVASAPMLDVAPGEAVEVAAASGKHVPVKVLLIGDSSIEAGLGTELERDLTENYEGITVERFGLHSTGLARPDYFNWADKIIELKAEFEPDVVIAYFGDNDCQGLSDLAGDFVAKFGSEEWDAEYGKRVESVVGLMQADDGHGVMIGMPIMRQKSFSNKVKRLNTVAEAATTEAGGIYLPTWGVTSDEKGKYLPQVEYEDKVRVIRAGDGIHFSQHGSRYVAEQLCNMLEDYFDMTRVPSTE